MVPPHQRIEEPRAALSAPGYRCRPQLSELSKVIHKHLLKARHNSSNVFCSGTLNDFLKPVWSFLCIKSSTVFAKTPQSRIGSSTAKTSGLQPHTQFLCIPICNAAAGQRGSCISTRPLFTVACGKTSFFNFKTLAPSRSVSTWCHCIENVQSPRIARGYLVGVFNLILLGEESPGNWNGLVRELLTGSMIQRKSSLSSPFQTRSPLLEVSPVIAVRRQSLQERRSTVACCLMHQIKPPCVVLLSVVQPTRRPVGLLPPRSSPKHGSTTSSNKVSRSTMPLADMPFAHSLKLLPIYSTRSFCPAVSSDHCQQLCSGRTVAGTSALCCESLPSAWTTSNLSWNLYSLDQRWW